MWCVLGNCNSQEKSEGKTTHLYLELQKFKDLKANLSR